MRQIVPILLLTLTAAPLVQLTPIARAQNRPTGNAAAAPGRLANDQYQSLDSNPTLFAVLAAINAAGYDADADSPSNHGLRKAVRDYLGQREFESLPALQRFVRDHPATDASGRQSDEAELNQYVSFALLSTGAPDFGPARPDIPQPPDAAALQELPPLLAAFHAEANLASLYEQALPYYEQALEQYTGPVSSEVVRANTYLRIPLQGVSRDRRFQIFVDLLGAPHQVITRTYLDDYYVVVTPSPEPRIEEIRHTYFHYLVDGWGIRHKDKLKRLESLGDYTLDSPLLAEQYRQDFNLLTTECFIKALEARVTRQPDAVDQAMREGFILTAAFYDALPAYEEQERTMELHFPELVDSFDIKAEAERIGKVEFATEREVRTIQVTRMVGPPPATGVDKTLEDAEDAIRARNVELAKQTLNRVFTETQEKRLHARAYYGLARVAVLERDPEAGDGLFRRVLDLDPDGPTKSWSLLYLGKLADSQNETEPAQQFYREALAVPDAPDQVRREAQQGLEGAFARGRTQ